MCVFMCAHMSDACMNADQPQWYVMASGICVSAWHLGKQQHMWPSAHQVITRNDLFYSATQSHPHCLRHKVSLFSYHLNLYEDSGETQQ